jgi:hypothetical protein
MQQWARLNLHVLLKDTNFNNLKISRELTKNGEIMILSLSSNSKFLNLEINLITL